MVPHASTEESDSDDQEILSYCQPVKELQSKRAWFGGPPIDANITCRNPEAEEIPNAFVSQTKRKLGLWIIQLSRNAKNAQLFTANLSHVHAELLHSNLRSYVAHLFPNVITCATNSYSVVTNAK